jgi:hypothetical protein
MCSTKHLFQKMHITFGKLNILFISTTKKLQKLNQKLI